MSEPRQEHYSEAAPVAALSSHVSCLWRRRAAGGERTYRIVPDGCMDIIWDETRIFVAGPDTGPMPTKLPPGARLMAMRFRPGAAPAALAFPPPNFATPAADLEALWGAAARRLAQRLSESPDEDSVAAELQSTVARRLPRHTDPVVRGAVEAATAVPYETAPLSVTALADSLGYSERQLRRRCLAAFGYGPAMLRRVLRFHRAVTLVQSGRADSYAQLAAALGYTDQAHLARDVRALAGTSLSMLREN